MKQALRFFSGLLIAGMAVDNANAGLGHFTPHGKNSMQASLACLTNSPCLTEVVSKGGVMNAVVIPPEEPPPVPKPQPSPDPEVFQAPPEDPPGPPAPQPLPKPEVLQELARIVAAPVTPMPPEDPSFAPNSKPSSTGNSMVRPRSTGVKMPTEDPPPPLKPGKAIDVSGGDTQKSATTTDSAKKKVLKGKKDMVFEDPPLTTSGPKPSPGSFGAGTPGGYSSFKGGNSSASGK